MAASTISLKTRKAPKKPKITASKSAFDNYEKKKREVDAHNKKAAAEKARRKKILAK
jgi:hypothetical protein